MDLRDIFFYRNLLDWFIGGIFLFLALLSPESCDVSSPSVEKANGRVSLTIFAGLLIDVLYFIRFIKFSTTTIESGTRCLLIRSLLLVAKIFPMQIFHQIVNDDDDWKIDRLFQHATVCRQINGSYDFEYCLDPRRTTSRCVTISRRYWTIPEMILILIVVELIAFLSAYVMGWWKAREDRRLELELMEAPLKHRSSIWWHRRIDYEDRGAWHDYNELIAFLAEYNVDGASSPAARPFLVANASVIDLTTSKSSDDTAIDRLIFSTIIFDCKECESDDGIYLVIISEMLRKYRLVKLSSTLPWHDLNGRVKIRTFVQDDLLMCVFEHEEGERTMFLSYNIKDDSKHEFDVYDILEFDDGCFWCLKDDGRDAGRAIRKGSTCVRIIYACKRTDQLLNVSNAIRQSLVEIPTDDGEVNRINHVQEMKYRSNWKFTDHSRLIRTSQGHVGVICQLVDSSMSTGEGDDDGTRWSTCVMYSPETRRLWATADYEKYFEIDPSLRKYFDRTVNAEYESLRFGNITAGHRFHRMVLCPDVLTDARAIDVLNDGSIRSIDFEPRSLKWLSLRSVFDVYGKEYLQECGEGAWFGLTGVKLDAHFWD